MLRTRYTPWLGVLVLLLLATLLPARGVDIAIVEAGAPSHAQRVEEALQAGGMGAIHSQTLYGSTDWLTHGFLHAGNPAQEPEVEYHDIQNHSWVGQSGPDGSLAMALDALYRLDHAIVRDGFTAVVSLENGRSSAVPELLGHSYNVITVGRLDGKHSRGGTWLDGIGRTKPDLVGVMPATSLNVPAVSAVAALLMQTADDGPSEMYQARRPEAIKAILLASADKAAVPSWEADPDGVLDPVYGAGVLDPMAALAVLKAGPQFGDLGPQGWHLDWMTPRTAAYRFSVPNGTRVEELSVALVWNRQVTDSDPGPGFLPEVRMPDLDLDLYREAPDGTRRTVATSTGRVNNEEYLYVPRLRPGRYVMNITGDDGTPYALAWNGRALVNRLDR